MGKNKGGGNKRGGKQQQRNGKGSHKQHSKYAGEGSTDNDVRLRNEQQQQQPPELEPGQYEFCQPTGDLEASSKIELQGLRLRMWDFAQCDPKRCSGARLARRGIFQKMPLKTPFRGIVLDPEAKIPVSPADLEVLEQS